MCNVFVLHGQCLSTRVYYPCVSVKSEVGVVLSTFMDFLSRYSNLLVHYLKLGLNRFLSYHLQFTSHPITRRYSV